MDDQSQRRRRARHTVRAEMARREWTNSDLAEAAQVDVKTVNDFLSGKRWPQRNSRTRIETALDLPIDTIQRQVDEGTLGDERGALQLVEETLAPGTVLADLDVKYGQVVEFTELIRRTYPALTVTALQVMVDATNLYQHARGQYLDQNPQVDLEALADRLLADAGGQIDGAFDLADMEEATAFGSAELMLDVLRRRLEHARRLELSEPGESLRPAAEEGTVEDPGEHSI